MQKKTLSKCHYHFHELDSLSGAAIYGLELNNSACSLFTLIPLILQLVYNSPLPFNNIFHGFIRTLIFNKKRVNI